jgi:hypothetical protein
MCKPQGFNRRSGALLLTVDRTYSATAAVGLWLQEMNYRGHTSTDAAIAEAVAIVVTGGAGAGSRTSAGCVP